MRWEFTDRSQFLKYEGQEGPLITSLLPCYLECPWINIAPELVRNAESWACCRITGSEPASYKTIMNTLKLEEHWSNPATCPSILWVDELRSRETL